MTVLGSLGLACVLGYGALRATRVEELSLVEGLGASLRRRLGR